MEDIDLLSKQIFNKLHNISTRNTYFFVSSTSSAFIHSLLILDIN